MTDRPDNLFRPKWTHRTGLLLFIAAAIACGGPSFSTTAPPEDASGEPPGMDVDNTPIIICPPCPSGASDGDGGDATVEATTGGDGRDATVEAAVEGGPGDASTMGEHGDETAIQPRDFDATVDTGTLAEASGTPPSGDAAGTLDASTHPALAQGVACAQTSDCVSGLFCVDSVCCATAACPAIDQCHMPGICEPITGLCTDPVAEDGTSCNDGNACTQVDTCHGGICSGANPIQCNAIDVCHSAGTCNPSTGACSTPPAPGANCLAGQPCLAWYPDCDNDGYGALGALPVCSTSSPGVSACGTGGYAQSNTDCCDGDSRANPGQTGWFTGQTGTDKCGSWDYNCSGRSELEYTNLNVCSSFTCAGTVVGSNGGACIPSPTCSGYMDGNPPCGASESTADYLCQSDGIPNDPCSVNVVVNVPPTEPFPAFVWQGCH